VRRWAPLIAAVMLLSPPLALVYGSGDVVVFWLLPLDARSIKMVPNADGHGCTLFLRSDSGRVRPLHASGYVCYVSNGTRFLKSARSAVFHTSTGLEYVRPIRIGAAFVVLAGLSFVSIALLFLMRRVLAGAFRRRVLPEESELDSRTLH
jgi:hypothetical protein